MKKSVIAMMMGIALFLSLTLSACDTMGNQAGETIGTVVGMTIGALLGSEIGDSSGQGVATAIGAVTGRLVGAGLGKALDGRDWELAEANAQDTLENKNSGETGSWDNPDSGNSGTIKPGDTYTADSGEDCRDFESSVVVDGKTEVATGRACKQADGSWLIIQ
ncbi:MAG: hypothetical protein HOC63_16045 [Rhodospirillales bacterium]|nr:hypothetical protein [Rhodospirillales bacterium]